MKIFERSKSSDALRDETTIVKSPGSTISRDANYPQISSLRKKIFDLIRMNREINLRDLIQEVSIEGGFKSEIVAQEIMNLEDEGSIKLFEPRKCETFPQYMVSPNSAWFLGSIATIAVAILLVFLPMYLVSFFSQPFVYLRYFFGGILVVFLPGYSLIESLFPNRSHFDDLTKYALSFVLSLALVTLISLILGVSPIGLETLPITVTIALITTALLFVALKRKYDYYAIAHHFE